jgi:hypothetical protein
MGEYGYPSGRNQDQAPTSRVVSGAETPPRSADSYVNNERGTGDHGEVRFVDSLIAGVGRVPICGSRLVRISALVHRGSFHSDLPVLHEGRSFVGGVGLAIDKPPDEHRRSVRVSTSRTVGTIYWAERAASQATVEMRPAIIYMIVRAITFLLSPRWAGLRRVEIQDSHLSLLVIQAPDGSVRFD